MSALPRVILADCHNNAAAVITIGGDKKCRYYRFLLFSIIRIPSLGAEKEFIRMLLLNCQIFIIIMIIQRNPIKSDYHAYKL